jgi:hypothetical protein
MFLYHGKRTRGDLKLVCQVKIFNEASILIRRQVLPYGGCKSLEVHRI